MCHLDRSNKNGCGVAIYIQNTQIDSIINHVTNTIVDVLECLSVEVLFHPKNNNNNCNIMSLQTSNLYY